MNANPTGSSGALKAVGYVLFALLLLLVTAVGCYLLLPIYSKPLALYLSTEADGSYNKGHYVQSVAQLTQAAALDSKNALILNNLAWLLATCPDAKARDGKKAVPIATQACTLTNWQNGAYVDTLAAAYAETGDFDNAVKWENKYLSSLSLSASDAADGESRLALYQAHQPYHADQ